VEVIKNLRVCDASLTRLLVTCRVRDWGYQLLSAYDIVLDAESRADEQVTSS